MFSTLKGRVPLYLGADLTDRYAKACRDVDVCGLTPGENNKLTASFWFWRWDAAPRPLNVTVITKELSATRAAMLDGPQGLAYKGTALRQCERQAACVGKTPDQRPSLEKPFAGFIRSSLDIFAALRRAGTKISPPAFLHGVSEVYPGHIWQVLAGRSLPKKSTEVGRRARKYILEALGVSDLPELPTHDQNDACVAALLAAAAGGAVRGITARGIGSPLYADGDGTFREGPMAIPEVTATTSKLIWESLSRSHTIAIAQCDVPPVTSLGSGTPNDRAERLLDWLIAKAPRGNARVCTYSWAYRYLFSRSHGKWSQACTKQVVEAAQRTRLRELPGLGAVRLDAFVVAKGTGLPGEGHWRSAHYDREDWERVLGTAMVFHQRGQT